MKLLILHDSPEFGGHERMLLALLPAVLDDAAIEVVAALPAANERLRAALAAASPRIRLIRWPFVKRRGEPYLHRFRWRYRAAVRRLVDAERPDTVLLVQGRIENLVVPMRALPRSQRIVSYVPMAHLQTEMGRRGLGDRVRRALYRRPNRFIVPGEAVAAQLVAAGAVAPVTVAPNVVASPQRIDTASARAATGLADAGRVALFLGRLDTEQKGIDLLLAAIARAGRSLDGWTFVFVGDGPARDAITAAGLRVVPWTDAPATYLCAADVLLLPSRWEGVPLVMLEAMGLGLPIVASDIDVYRQYLPAANIVDFTTVDLAAVLERTANDADAFAAAARAKLAPLTIEAARAAFAQALAA